jgi:hypothetical protein
MVKVNVWTLCLQVATPWKWSEWILFNNTAGFHSELCDFLLSEKGKIVIIYNNSGQIQNISKYEQGLNSWCKKYICLNMSASTWHPNFIEL